MKERAESEFSVCVLTLLLCLLPFGRASADVKLARIFTDSMVLQRDLPIVVWGEAAAGEEVTVSFVGSRGTAVTSEDRTWRVTLPALPADGESHELTVQGQNVLTLKNVVLGEVWLCAGQSNMNRSIEIKESDPDVRLYWIDFSTVPRSRDLNEGISGWVPSTPEGLASAAPISEGRQRGKPRRAFPEVGYVFGRKIQRELNVPVGLIKAAVGGSTVSTWTPHGDMGTKYPLDVEVPKKRYIAHTPGLLYQSMIHGLVPFSMRGVIWYQGEDDGRSRRYAEDVTAWIKSWRDLWKRDDMPFYMVQIAQTTYASGMLGVWEAQTRVVKNVAHTGLAVSNDIYDGTTNKGFQVRMDKVTGWPLAGGSNPHPPNKQLVAQRLADIALAKSYGRKRVVVEGPMYESHRIDGSKIVVTLRNAGTGLALSSGKELNWFQLSDGSKEGRKLKFVKAKARISGRDSIAISSSKIAEPKFLRFAWHPLARHNLINSEGLPAVSFRTDEERR